MMEQWGAPKKRGWEAEGLPMAPVAGTVAPVAPGKGTLSGPGRGGARLSPATDGVFCLSMPAHATGRLIGSAGSSLARIKTAHPNVTLKVAEDHCYIGDPGEDIGDLTNCFLACTAELEGREYTIIRGPNGQEEVVVDPKGKKGRAARMSEKGLAPVAGKGPKGASMEFYVPDHQCGAVIGPKGATIQELRNSTGCDILVEKESQEGKRRVVISGPDDWTVQACYTTVMSKIEEDEAKRGSGGERPPKGAPKGYGAWGSGPTLMTVDGGKSAGPYGKGGGKGSDPYGSYGKNKGPEAVPAMDPYGSYGKDKGGKGKGKNGDKGGKTAPVAKGAMSNPYDQYKQSSSSGKGDPYAQYGQQGGKDSSWGQDSSWGNSSSQGSWGQQGSQDASWGGSSSWGQSSGSSWQQPQQQGNWQQQGQGNWQQSGQGNWQQQQW